MPLPSSLEPEPEVLGVVPAFSVLPEWQVNLLYREALALGGVGIPQLQAGEGGWLADNSDKGPENVQTKEY